MSQKRCRRWLKPIPHSSSFSFHSHRPKINRDLMPFFSILLLDTLTQSLSRFRGLCRCPERAWINAVRMQCQHLLVKVHRRRCTCHTSVKVMDVTSSFLDVTGRTIGVRHAMTGYHRQRMQRLDLIERAEIFWGSNWSAIWSPSFSGPRPTTAFGCWYSRARTRTILYPTPT